MTMRGYYIDLGFKDVRRGLYDAFDFDENGIPKYCYSFGHFYNITFICHYALYHYTLFLKFKRMNNLDIFMHVSDWIIKNGEETSDCFVFPYSFPWNGMSPPWISALGQGRILSVLTRAYEFSGDKHYLNIARKAMNPFATNIADGGVQTKFPDGELAFAEYPYYNRKPNIVLNGFITSLVGLYDLAEIGEEHRAADLFYKGLYGLESNLHRYDLGYWSAYDLFGLIPNVASDEYHLYHIMQLWALFEMTGRDFLKSYARRWYAYRKGLRLFFLRSLSKGYRKLHRIISRTITNLNNELYASHL